MWCVFLSIAGGELRTDSGNVTVDRDNALAASVGRENRQDSFKFVARADITPKMGFSIPCDIIVAYKSSLRQICCGGGSLACVTHLGTVP